MAIGLPISNLIKVDVNLSAVPSQIQNIQTLLILGSSDVIDNEEKIRTYSSLTQVAQDFGTTAPEYLGAVAWFAQTPQPKDLKIGQWNKTAVAGRLIGGVVATADQIMSTWTAITNGSFKINIDGSGLVDVTDLDFSGETNLNGVADVVTAGLTGAVCTWDSVFQRFTIKSTTTGVTSTISFLSSAASGTDISSKLKMTSVSSGAYVVDGLASETPLQATARMEDSFGQEWYALFIAGIENNTDHLDVADFIEGSNTKHAYVINTNEGGVLVATNTNNIAYLAKSAGYKRTVVQYSSKSNYSVISLLARILTTDYNANKSVITLMYKQEPTIEAENLSQTQMNALQGFNCNVFIKYNNDTAIIQEGKVADGNYVDVIFGTDWLALTIQNNVYNLLYSNPYKIPQTNDGHNIIANTIAQTLEQSVRNGLVAAGQWNQTGFGTLKQYDYLDKGYYIFVDNVDNQNVADRAARKSMPFQIAAKLAGAIHTVDVMINVDR